MSARSSPPTTAFTQHSFYTAHLSSPSIAGSAVLLRTGACVYSSGVLSQHEGRQNWMPIANLFPSDAIKKQDLGSPPQLVLNVEEYIKFTTFYYSEHSLYATSAGRLYGLVICRIPLGILVCLTQPPIPMSNAVAAVEHIASKLRI